MPRCSSMTTRLTNNISDIYNSDTKSWMFSLPSCTHFYIIYLFLIPGSYIDPI